VSFIPHPLRVGLKRSPSTLTLVAYASITLLIVLGCRTADLIAQGGATPTRTAIRATVRPTFTTVPPTEPPTDVPPLTALPVVPTRAPAPRIVPTRVPTPAKSATPAPPPPTPDPYAGYYYKPVNKGCVTAPNTRIQGTVIENGQKKNGVLVRVSDREGGGPSIDDFTTGVDPSDYKHQDPSLQGQYRLALYEGQKNAGNWWVFIIDSAGNLLSPGVLVTTQDIGGCNTATVDFVHQ
jgi:hypothetical protein